MSMNINGNNTTYAGRFDNFGLSKKKIDLFEEIEAGRLKPAVMTQKVEIPYKVTLSEEGLNSAELLREYAKSHPEQFNTTSYDEQLKELNEMLHTNSMDMSLAIQQEMGAIVDELKNEYQLNDKTLTIEEKASLMAKAYMTVAKRIEEEFERPDRETTYILDNEGNRIVETKEDRMNELKKAYLDYAELQGNLEASKLRYNQAVNGEMKDVSADDVKNNTIQLYEDAISNENQNKEEVKSEKITGRISVNTGKLARMIAAAKTKDQLRAVMAKIRGDLKSVKEGMKNGMCDQAEVDKVTALMAMAENRMGEVEDREATKEEESMFSLVSLM